MPETTVGNSSDDFKRIPHECGLMQGRIYTAGEILTSFRITEKTLQTWIDEGLKPARKHTKTRFFLGDHIIRYLFSE